MKDNSNAAVSEDDEVISVTLKKVLTTTAGEKITRLDFREPELGDAIDAEENGGGPNQQTAFVLSRMCGIQFNDFRRIKSADFNKILDKTVHWLGNGEEDGEISPS